MKKLLLSLGALITFFLVFSSVNPVQAQYGYGGGGPSYSILIDKMVGKPSVNKGGTTYEYVDNLTSSDPRFQPGQEVMFQVKIKNTSTTSLTSVTFKDFVPVYLEPVEGPGSFDSTNRTISLNAGDFGTDEEKIYYLKMKAVGQDSLPSDKGLFCIVNKAQVYNDQAADDDTAQLCIEKQVKAGVVTPQAGPEAGLVILSGELALLGLGIFLKKRVS
ncbi:hypothetical protein COT62_00945 [Candidatus Roizmanbacteria bacterium CG09_land_8_20_14_0_10_41_9]|uniref:DUF11 domain-containing protein n=1 Tax=Candidatus Roizmanbacteria bacterium CG09_land_8_20_14_0_10_41_9 TaxID=1974850 RepID=A0A2H0WTH8_9BACT|nr:MAG: hypothetical protein COT62_00945 [Candidatus Roizmanbacteria bacterium CG09_land_8_20_14_0_10_41_9]